MRFIVEKVFTWLCALSLLVACTQESETDGVVSTGSGFLLSLYPIICMDSKVFYKSILSLYFIRQIYVYM